MRKPSFRDSDGTGDSDSSTFNHNIRIPAVQNRQSFIDAEVHRMQAESSRKDAWDAKKQMHLDSLQMMKEEHSWYQQDQGWQHCERMFDFQQKLFTCMENPSTSARQKAIYSSIAERCLAKMEHFAATQQASEVTSNTATDAQDDS
eukprot:411160-Hanusia_phi.AAC.1